MRGSQVASRCDPDLHANHMKYYGLHAVARWLAQERAWLRCGARQSADIVMVHAYRGMVCIYVSHHEIGARIVHRLQVDGHISCVARAARDTPAI